MDEYFELDQNSTIIIYGAATTGSLLVDRLKETGIKILGFIDKRAYEIGTLKGYPVWDIFSEELAKQMKKEPVIFIAVKSVFQHPAIINELLKNIKCHKYIYMPLEGEEQYCTYLKRAFNNLLYKNICYPYIIPYTKKVNLNNFSRQDGRIEKRDKVVLAVPVGMIYTNYTTDKKHIWCNIPLLALFPHLRLFEFFESAQSGRTSSYIEFCVEASKNMGILQTEEWKKNILENRKGIYDEMLNEYELNSRFFYENAPEAVWNEKGYFNLKTGKHRSIFLLNKKCRYIPLCISKYDEEKWIQFHESKRLYSFLEKNKKVFINAPIDNPFFLKYKNRTGDFWPNVLRWIVCFLAEYTYKLYGKVKFEGIQVLNLYERNRYIIRYLYKMGAQIYDLTPKSIDEDYIDSALHCNYKPIIEDNKEKKYHLLLVEHMDYSINEGRKVDYVLCHTFEEKYKSMAQNVISAFVCEEILNLFMIDLRN